MLYNVLPPLIFFMSLGGIIIVISRIVLRLRQQQLTTNLQSHVTRVSRTRLNKVQDLAGLLAPNHISVHSFKNRLSFLVHNIKNTWHKTWQDITEWQANKAKAKTLVKKQPLASSAPTASAKSSSSPAAITPPNSFVRNKLASIVTRVKQVRLPNTAKFTHQAAAIFKTTKDKLMSLTVHPSVQTSSKSVNNHQNLEEILADPIDNASAPDKTKQSPVLRIVNTDEQNTPKPAPSPVMTKMGQSVKASSLSQLFKKELKKSPLQEAAEALEQLQTKRAEDLLVPYIVKHPKDTDAYMMLGRAAISRHAWSEATEIFEQVIKLKPETEGCYAALGQAALEAGNLTKAIETLQRAHDQNPQNVFVITCLLQIARRMDNRPMQQSLNLELQQLEKLPIPNSQS